MLDVKNRDRICKNIAKYFNCEDAAVTVDWVVLTAAIVLLGTAVLTTVSEGTNDMAYKITGCMGDQVWLHSPKDNYEKVERWCKDEIYRKE